MEEQELVEILEKIERAQKRDQQAWLITKTVIAFSLIAGLILGFGANVDLDMKEEVDAGDYRFRFAEDLEEAYGDQFDISDRTLAFVPKSDTENWEPSWGQRNVYIMDQRPFFEMYEDCWHEIRHWELAQSEELSTEEDHEIIDNTPFYAKHRWECDKALVTGFAGIS